MLWKLLSAIELRKQCRLLVPFLFGEANPNPNLKPTCAGSRFIAGRARPDEPEVVGGVLAGGGVVSTPAFVTGGLKRGVSCDVRLIVTCCSHLRDAFW